MMEFTEETELKDFFGGIDKVAFFGTGGMGKNLYIYLKNNGWERKLACFLVTRKQMDEFWGIGVKEVAELKGAGLPVVIATRHNYHESICHALSLAGVTEIYTLSEDLLNRVEGLANQSFHFDFGPCTKRHEAWVARKVDIIYIRHRGFRRTKRHEAWVARKERIQALLRAEGI